jgi:hypothetical protein
MQKKGLAAKEMGFMQTEESLRAIIQQHDRSIKALKEEIAEIRAKKKKYQAILRDIRWEKKQARRQAS